jgi:hypothetical protein
MLGQGITLTPEKLQMLSGQFDPFPVLKAIQAAETMPAAPMGQGALGTGITPPGGTWDSMVNGQKPAGGQAPLTPDAMKQLSAMMTPQRQPAPPVSLPSAPPQVQTTPIVSPLLPQPQGVPTLNKLLYGG